MVKPLKSMRQSKNLIRGFMNSSDLNQKVEALVRKDFRRSSGDWKRHFRNTLYGNSLRLSAASCGWIPAAWRLQKLYTQEFPR